MNSSLKEAWKDQVLTDSEIKSRLTPLQYRVVRKDETEKPFDNPYWNHKEAGIYVDIVKGEPLFSSLDKYDSGTGWPSFIRPLVADHIVYRKDKRFLIFGERTEVRSRYSDSHLGHVFDDGPPPTGKRYCINSAALRFVPVSRLEAEGYGAYAALFQNKTVKESRREVAILGGGCFWGVEDLIRKLPGVIETEVGYAGGTTASPTYEQVKTGKTGHAEVVRIEYDPDRVSYQAILEYFFRLHDPTTRDRQGNDVGTQYRSVIFYQTPEQKKVAESVKAQVDKSKKWKDPVVTQIMPPAPFYSAESYHQDYLVKNPGGYTCHYLRD